MTYEQERAVLEVYPTEQERDADRYMVARPNDPADLIARIQRGAYIATLD